MFELDPIAIMLVMFAVLIVLLLAGVPVVFAMGSIGAITLLLLWGFKYAPSVIVGNAFTVMTWHTLVALPLFVFMAMILKSSGIVEDLFRSIRLWLAPVPGGLAMAVVVVSVFIAAMSGAIATGTLILGIIALPIMLKYGYDKTLAIGPIMAGGALANLIPPSNSFIVYGALAEVSIGQLFIGGVVPGLILATMYILYIFIRCSLKPSLGPPVPMEERVGWLEKFASLRALLLPIALIASVLGAIFFGIASATEAAAVGAVGALVCAAVRRNLKWKHIKDANLTTVRVSSMVVWIFMGAWAFKGVFALSGGPQIVADWVVSLGLPSLGVIGIMMVVFVIMGCFVSSSPIMLITLPVFLPIVDALGFGRLWFGVLALVNFQLSDLTPPFGFSLFYMRSVAPPEITMGDIIRAVVPFLPLMAIGVALVMFFPALAEWLPSLMLQYY